jgi:hypothetical protein
MHVAYMGTGEVQTGFWCEYHFENPGVDWRIILKWVLEKWGGDMGWIDSGKGQ